MAFRISFKHTPCQKVTFGPSLLLTTTTKTETNSNYTQRQLLGTTKKPNYQELHMQATTSHYKKQKHPTTIKDYTY